MRFNAPTHGRAAAYRRALPHAQSQSRNDAGAAASPLPAGERSTSERSEEVEGLLTYRWTRTPSPTPLPCGEREQTESAAQLVCHPNSRARARSRALQSDRCAHEIALAELDAAVAQDVVGGGAVEIEVRQDEIEQQSLPGELALVVAELERDVLVLGAVDLRRFEALAEVNHLGESALELGEARLGVRQVRHLDAGERAATARRVGRGLLHLPRIGIHVGVEPHVEEETGVELLGVDMRLQLVDAAGLGGQELHENRHRTLVHGDGHWNASFLDDLAIGRFWRAEP